MQVALRRLAADVRDSAKARLRLARLLVGVGFPLVSVTAACDAVLGVLPIAFALGTSAVVSRIPAHGWTDTLGPLVVASVAFAGQQMLVPVQWTLGELVARRIDGQVLDRLMAAALRAPGIAAAEDQRLLELLGRAHRELEGGFQSPGKGAAALLHLLARVTQLIGFVVVVALAFSWLAAVGLLATVVVFRHGQRGGLHKYTNVFRANAGVRREGDYLRELSMAAGAAKEIRVFGLISWLTDRYRDNYLSWLMPAWRARRRIMLWPYFWYTGFGLVMVGAVLAAVGAAGTVALAAADVALVVQAVMGALRLGEYYPEADVQTEYGADAYNAVLEFERGMADHKIAAPADGERPVPVPCREIAFEGVTFRYPGADTAVFDDLNLRLPVGRCTAVVGVNGAGKTTLVKLLARLYEPESGAVTVDGVDIREFPMDAWRSRLAVVFQDFLRHERTARDNIGLGAVEHLADVEAIRSAAADASVLSIVDDLPAGMDTPLAAHVTGGVDLSGGQWQRIALARALFRLARGGSLLVLDEPTASLDVRAEARFFEEFARLTAGRTSLLISHRFSTVRHADHIVVLVDGKVFEEGTHASLLSAGGRYAKLFQLQADRFIKDASEAVA